MGVEFWGVSFGGRAPLGPDLISQSPFFAASGYFDVKVRKISFLFGWDLVVSDMACHLRAVVVAVAFNVPPCTHLDLSIPDWPFVRELFAENVFPQFARCHFEILIVWRVLNKITLLPFLFFHFFLLSPFPTPSFPAAACLNSLMTAVLDGSTAFLKLAGRFIWKTSFSTCSS